MKNLLGVDFGTTALKASLFDQDGNLIDSKSVQYKLITKGEFIEFDAEEFFNVFISTVNEIRKNYRIDALAVDTQGETLIVLDKDGKPLMNAIIWLDNRAEKQAKDMTDKFGLKKIYDITGQAEIPAGYPAPKIKWLEENEPEIFNKADKFLLLEDYILYRLTGKFSASRSLYSSSLLLNVKTGEYEKEILDWLNIDQSKLPVLFESGEKVGEYEGIAVCTSALDQIAGITGAGVVKTGLMSETTGTALAVCALTDKIPAYKEGLKVSVYYVKKGVYCMLMWAPTAGAVLEWYKREFCENFSLKDLDDLASKVNKGSDGLICIPHLCGTVMPENNPNAKGVFFGATLGLTRAHFVRSIMESIAYMIKEYVDYLNVPVTEIRSMGGGAKSKIWCEIKSEVLNKKLVTLKQNETATLGSAIFAGVAIGVYKSVESATDKLVGLNKEYSVLSDEYNDLYNDYKKKEKAIINLF